MPGLLFFLEAHLPILSLERKIRGRASWQVQLCPFACDATISRPN